MAIAIGRIFAIAASVAIVVGLLVPTSAWIFYEDDRRPSHSVMVGRLEVKLPQGTASGTAALVDECGILTNFHVVFGPWYVTTFRAPSREFWGTFTLTEAMLPDGTHPSARAIPVTWGEYLGPDRQLRVPDHDWAYLVLDRCLGLEYGHFQLHELDLEDLKEPLGGFAALGYSTGKQMLDPACFVHAARSQTGNEAWLHDCALEAGDSGGPIIKRGTSALVALGASIVANPGDPGCPSGGLRYKGVPLAQLSIHCANVAVPLTRDTIERVQVAHIATAVQRMLNELGYDAGPLGAIDGPRAIAAIKEVQRDMAWPVTGEPTHSLWKILRLKTLMS